MKDLAKILSETTGVLNTPTIDTIQAIKSAEEVATVQVSAKRRRNLGREKEGRNKIRKRGTTKNEELTNFYF